MTNLTPTRLSSAAQRKEPIANFQACVERELERLHRPPEQSKLAVAVAARYRRALRDLGGQIVGALRDEPSGDLRQKVSSIVKTARAKPDEISHGSTLEVLRDAIDAIEAVAAEAIARIETKEREAMHENRQKPVIALVSLVAACLLFLFCVEFLTSEGAESWQAPAPATSSVNCPPATKDGRPLPAVATPANTNAVAIGTPPPRAAAAATENKCPPPPKEARSLTRPVLHGLVMIAQVTSVLAVAALIVAFMYAMRIALAERLAEALFERAKDAGKGPPAGPGPEWTLLNQNVIRLDNRVDALVKTNTNNKLDFMHAYNYTNDRLWRLCFETHLLAKATGTLRKGLVNFGAGEPPDRIGLNCRSVFALPPPPPPPLPPDTSE